jgi:mannitol/fructose-specific phosphotransferase system IIA component (Ntr-type)
MQIRRFLRPESIRLELRTRVRPEESPVDEDFDPESAANLRRIRESIFEEIVELFDATGEVANPKKLWREFDERERKAVTAIGRGLAIPHVRTLQVKTFLMAFARSRDGLPFRAPDEEPVHIFLAMVAPPYDDRTYLKLYRSLAKSVLETSLIDELMSAEDPSEILLALKNIEG